jgi:hypothetical protein
MSTQQLAGRPEHAQQAYQYVHENLYQPVFFTKLANVFGIQPKTQAEADELLAMADQLRSAHDQEQVKQASAQGGMISEAAGQLNQQLEAHGFQPQGSGDANVIKEASAAALQQQPDLAQAILDLQAGVAQNLVAADAK